MAITFTPVHRESPVRTYIHVMHAALYRQNPRHVPSSRQVQTDSRRCQCVAYSWYGELGMKFYTSAWRTNSMRCARVQPRLEREVEQKGSGPRARWETVALRAIAA